VEKIHGAIIIHTTRHFLMKEAVRFRQYLFVFLAPGRPAGRPCGAARPGRGVTHTGDGSCVTVPGVTFSLTMVLVADRIKRKLDMGAGANG